MRITPLLKFGIVNRPFGPDLYDRLPCDQLPAVSTKAPTTGRPSTSSTVPLSELPG